MIEYLNHDSFTNTIQEKDVVLVDFFADWCGPCHAIHPTLEELSEEFDGKATIAKVNVDQEPGLAAAFKVRSIPTMFFFKNGKLVDSTMGVQTKSTLSKQLKDLVAA